MKLTTQACQGLETGQRLTDHVVRGLELRARGSVKTWHVYYRDDAGRQRRPKIGEFPLMGIELARDTAKEWLRKVMLGEDPAAKRRERREAWTVGELCDLYVAECAAEVEAGTRKPRTLEENERHVRLYIRPKLGKELAIDVSLQDVKAFHARIAEAAPVYANRVCDTLSSIFTLAQRSDVRAIPAGDDRHPVKGLARSREHKRRRHCTGAEFVALSQALAALQTQWPARVAAILTIAFVGSRVTEIATAKRSQRHGDRLILAEHKTDRTGDDRVIYLPAQARTILDALPDDGSGFLFEADLSRYRLYHVWGLACAAAGVEGLQLLDMRRTFASAAKSNGINLATIGELFGHKDESTTRRYAWLFDDAAIDATQRTADSIEGLMSAAGGQPAEPEYWSG